jgi:signal transduction histidine kinase/ligand-binding sensor domain-containing protein
MRFDGAKFNRWTPPEGQSLPGSNVAALVGTTDGSLWIGTTGGIAQLKDGQLFSHASRAGDSGGISAIIEDETGAIWFTRYRVNDGKGPLCQVKDKELRCFGKEDGISADYGLGLKKDAAGNIWFGSIMLCRWAPGSSSTYFEEELKNTGGDGVIDVAVGPSGSVWAALDGIGPKLGVRHYSGGKWESYVVPGFNGEKVRSHTLFTDSKTSLWVGTESEGIYHIYDGIADRYGIANGLSGISVSSIYEDREGNIWVATESGVDMFRDTPVVSFTSNEGLSGTDIDSIVALNNGTVLVGNQQAVDILRAGNKSEVTTLSGLPGEDVMAMLEDRAGRIWMGVDDRLVTYQNNRFSEVRKLNGSPLGHIGLTMSLTEDADASIWALIVKPDSGRHLLRIKDQSVQEDIPLDDSIRRPIYLAADRQANIWIASMTEKLARYRNGQVEVISLWEGEGLFQTYSLFVDSEDAVWVSTNKGLYRWKDGSLNLLDSRNGLPCSSVYAAIEDNYGSLWLYAQCGLLKIPATDLTTWREQAESKVSVKIFDLLDGAFPSPSAIISPRAAKSPDGRLWFTNGKIAQTIDPSRSDTNTIPPPVRIEELVADRKSYQTHGLLNLPPLKNELEINYTGLSFTVPQKVKFRYKLEGHDEDWQDVGTRRQAFYNNLSPGNYRFRVIASNNDGVWNEEGAVLEFSIAPMFYQTGWFAALCFGLIAALVWFIYNRRIKHIKARLHRHFEQRLNERTRIAQELHDTLLQGVFSASMQLDAANEQLPETSALKSKYNHVSQLMAQVMDEGRNTIRGLHSPGNNKTLVLENAFAELKRDFDARENIDFRVIVNGNTRAVHPIVRDEIYRLGREAIANAFRHSKADKIEVEIEYQSKYFKFSVRDNGCGMDQEILRRGREGHLGFVGMRECAERIGGKLKIWSRTEGGGTEIELIVPEHVAFKKESSGNFFDWLSKLLPRKTETQVSAKEQEK